MAALLFVLFVVVPLVEIYLVVQVAGVIGGLATLLLLIALSAFGVWLVKRVGIGMWRNTQAALERGDMPGRELVDGLLLLAAGTLLVVPGFLTAAVGLLLLVPPVRALVRNRLVARWGRDLGTGGRSPFGGRMVVDVEYLGDVTPRGPEQGGGRPELGSGS